MGDLARHIPHIEITSRSRASKLLLSRSQCARFGCLVSIGDPGRQRPSGFERISRRLRLVFDDVLVDGATEIAPTREDIVRLIRFARHIADTTQQVLVHCEAGISRSTAAAFILYAVWLGPGSEGDALARVFECVPEASPNRTMVRLGDELLQRGGAMVRALEARGAAAG